MSNFHPLADRRGINYTWVFEAGDKLLQGPVDFCRKNLHIADGIADHWQ
jgi:hypothetical protein